MNNKISRITIFIVLSVVNILWNLYSDINIELIHRYNMNVFVFEDGVQNTIAAFLWHKCHYVVIVNVLMILLNLWIYFKKRRYLGLRVFTYGFILIMDLCLFVYSAHVCNSLLDLSPEYVYIINDILRWGYNVYLIPNVTLSILLLMVDLISNRTQKT